MVFYNRFNVHNFSQELAAFKNVSFEQNSVNVDKDSLKTFPGC